FECSEKYTGRRIKTNSIKPIINRAGTAQINACGDSRLRGRRSRKPIDFRQWVVHEITGLKSTRASELIKILVDSKVIVPVTGHGKGKYRFTV
ncbi:MAG: hypothetical protein II073_10055, partial [Lachnospiraceae bacterium]|nr:hypothetical protein [Lachnospiraceae bacterium]